MNNRMWFWVAVGVLALATLAGVSSYSYNLGLAQGLAENGRAIGVVPRPWGLGFGFFPFFPFLFIFFWILVLRGLFWRGPWGYRRRYHDGVPPAFEEWHRRAHAREDATGSAAKADARA
jgi:hypothetical protein